MTKLREQTSTNHSGSSGGISGINKTKSKWISHLHWDHFGAVLLWGGQSLTPHDSLLSKRPFPSCATSFTPSCLWFYLLFVSLGSLLPGLICYTGNQNLVLSNMTSINDTFRHVLMTGPVNSACISTQSNFCDLLWWRDCNGFHCPSTALVWHGSVIFH